jgi:hypothetical protein
MKKAVVPLAACLLCAAFAYSEIQKDGFDVTILHSATKSLDSRDSRIAAFMKYLESNFKKESSGSWSSENMQNTESSYMDKKGNTVKVATEKNIKTGVGSMTVTIIGPEGFVTPIRAMLK